jgi:glycolate oxidase iron-sulfur subunit
MMHASRLSGDRAGADPACDPGRDARARIVELADQCVKCGLCLPVCPTYRVGRNEAESPRGRIAFAQALATGQIAASPTVEQHLDQCLACMSCERVCPSQVRYGELIVATRGLLRATSTKPLRLAFWLRHPRLLRAALHFANLPGLRNCIQSSIVQAALRPLRLDRLVRELPRLPRVIARARATTAVSRGRVGLFLGCIAAAADRDVHAAAVRLLATLGYEAVLPRGQACCGALAVHAGDLESADALGTPTRQAFIDAGVDTVLVSASGCFGTLRDRTFAGTKIRVREIHEFLDGDTRIGELKFRPLAQRAAVHTPCTQANIAHADAAIQRLLARIPQMEIVALSTEPQCCGAAGDYFLRHADIADALRTEKLDQTAALTPDLLVTSNVGCRIFLDNGLRQRGVALPVIHPIALLAQQLEN